MIKVVKGIDRFVRSATVSCFLTIPLIMGLLALAKVISIEHFFFGLEVSWLSAGVMFLTYYIPEAIIRVMKDGKGKVEK